MPRSKRNAVAARTAAAKGQPRDFEKTKTKLGKRKRSESLVTASAVKSRKIYVPPQDRAPHHAHALADHVARARDHYNPHARAAALTALSRMYADSPAFVADAALVVRAGLEALIDETPAVRVAALAAVVAVLRRVRAVRPFAALLSSALAAALSHIRSDVRVFGARATCALFQTRLFSPADVFGGAAVNPLPLLVALLQDISIASPRSRAAAANAIAAVSCWDAPEPEPTSAPALTLAGGVRGVAAPARPFYFHADGGRVAVSMSAGGDRVDVDVDALPLLMLSAAEAAQVVVGVSNMVLEYLPIGGNPSGALIAAARALSTVVCDASISEKEGRAAAARAVAAWASEQVYGASATSMGTGAADVDTSMASCAAALDLWETVAAFVCTRLRMGVTSREMGARGRTTPDSVAWRVLRSSRVLPEHYQVVAETWLECRWQHVVGSGFKIGDNVQADGAEEVVSMFRDITSSQMSENPETAWKCIEDIPVVVTSIARESIQQKEEDDVSTANDDKPRNIGCELVGAAQKLIVILFDAVRLHDMPKACSLRETIVERFIVQKDVFLWLETIGCLSQVMSCLWYVGAIASAPVLSLMRGGRGWAAAATIARVVEHTCSAALDDADTSSSDRIRLSRRNGIALLAASLSALLACVQHESRELACDAAASCKDKRIRPDVRAACIRIVKQQSVSEDSLRAVLQARKASDAEICLCLDLLSQHSIGT